MAISDFTATTMNDYGSCDTHPLVPAPPKYQANFIVVNEPDDLRSHRKPWFRLALVAFAIALASGIFFSGRKSATTTDSVKVASIFKDAAHASPQVPTLLSMYEESPDGCHLVNAVKNTLYDQLKQSFEVQGFEDSYDVQNQNGSKDAKVAVNAPTPSPTVSMAPVTFNTESPTNELSTSPSPTSSTKATVTVETLSPTTTPMSSPPVPIHMDTKPPIAVNVDTNKGNEVVVEGKKCHSAGKQKTYKHTIKLEVDRKRIKVHEKIVVRWTNEAPHSEVYDDDILALYCPAHEKDPTKFLEAGTIAQIKITNIAHQFFNRDDSLALSSFHLKRNDIEKENQWVIESFPIVREETCEFRLWRLPCVDIADVETDTEMTSIEAANPLDSLDAWTKKNPMQLLSRSGSFEIVNAKVTPTAIHLALTESPREMLVQFTTGHIDGATPVVRYIKKKHYHSHHSLSFSRKMKEVEGISSTYAASDMCDAPANITEAGKFVDPGLLHMVKLRHLKEDTEYIYMVGLKPHSKKHDYATVVWSNIYSFRSAPPVGDSNPFSIIVYGDQGCPADGWFYGSARTEKLVEREIAHSKTPIRAVHHIGDLSYATGAAHVWDEWFNMIEPIAARVPLMIAVGNHEYDHLQGGSGKDPSSVRIDGGFHPVWGDYENDSGGECGVPVAARFTMPSNTKLHRQRFRSNGVFWYSYDMSNVHIIVISSEHDLSKGSAQHAWLKEDLELVNRKVTPWVILESHRPLYESQMEIDKLDMKEKVSIVEGGLRDEFEWLLRRVDLVLSGHYHSYLRTCSGLFQGVCDNGGPTYITVGTAGAPLLSAGLYGPYLNFTERFITKYGYGRITVKSSRTLVFEFVDDADGSVLDSVWLSKK